MVLNLGQALPLECSYFSSFQGKANNNIDVSNI
jgi:hypothetical protein